MTTTYQAQNFHCSSIEFFVGDGCWSLSYPKSCKVGGFLDKSKIFFDEEFFVFVVKGRRYHSSRAMESTISLKFHSMTRSCTRLNVRNGPEERVGREMSCTDGVSANR
jgi:hypothetical protein